MLLLSARPVSQLSERTSVLIPVSITATLGPLTDVPARVCIQLDGSGPPCALRIMPSGTT